MPVRITSTVLVFGGIGGDTVNVKVAGKMTPTTTFVLQPDEGLGSPRIGNHVVRSFGKALATALWYVPLNGRLRALASWLRDVALDAHVALVLRGIRQGQITI